MEAMTKQVVEIPQKFTGVSEDTPLEDYLKLGSSVIMDSFMEREKWIAQGMFAFVCWEWVEPLAKWIGNRRTGRRGKYYMIGWKCRQV